MGGISFEGGELFIERPPNDLDELAIAFTEILDDFDVDHVYVSGYVAVLTGRSRATEDIDVLLERIDADTVDVLVDRLERSGLWGPAMPLDRMAEMLDDHIWIAREGEMVPHVEAKFVHDDLDRASLTNKITAHVGGTELPVGPLELQVAYKLRMSGDTDFEDAVHLYSLFGETLSTAELERWVDELGVREGYQRLRRT